MKPTPDEALLERLKEMGGYEQIRVLEDGTIVGLGNLMYTRAIYVNVDLWGHEKRFCFKDRELALQQYLALKTGDDEPEGWIARRPEPPGFYNIDK